MNLITHTLHQIPPPMRKNQPKLHIEHSKVTSDNSRPSADSLQKLLDSSLDIICSVDKHGRFITVSAAAKEMWGYEPEELIRKPYLDLVVEADKAATVRIAADIMAGKATTKFENHLICKDGTIKPILWSARWNKEERTMYAVAKDVTQLKAVELLQKQQKRRLQRTYKLAGIAWWELDVVTQVYTCSDEIYEMYGRPVAPNNQTTVEEFLSYVHPGDRARLQRDLSLMQQDTFMDYEHRVVKPSGAVIYVVHYAEVLRNSQGLPVALHGTAQETTRSKHYQLHIEDSERKLQQYTKRLSEILESIGDGFFSVDKDWKITYWNHRAEKLLGRNKEDVLGKHLLEEFKEVLPLNYYLAYRRALDEKRPVYFEAYYPHKDVWFEVSAYPSKHRLSVYFRDISERKQQELELQRSNERFQFVSEATSDVIWDWNLESGKLYINQSFTKTFGHHLQTEKALSQLWMENLHPEDRERVVSSQTLAIQNPAVSLWENSYRFLKANGNIAYIKDKAVILRNTAGKAVRLIGAAQDITEQKMGENRLEFMAKATSEVIWERRIDSDEVHLNGEKFEKLFGYKVSNNVISRSFRLDKFHPDDLKKLQKEKKYAIEHHLEFYTHEYRFKKADSSWAYVRDRTYIIRDEKGVAVSLMGAMEDVTQIRLAERAFQQSESSYRQMFDNAPLPMLISDAETLRYIDVNRAAVEHLGYSREEFLDRTVLDIRSPEEQNRVLNHIAEINKNLKCHTGQLIYLKKGGEKMLAEVSACVFNYKGKKAYLATLNDVTEKIRLQNELTREKVNHQKEVTKAVIEAQEAERSEIGKELHDGVNQLLTTAKLYVENIHYYPGQAGAFTTKSVEILQKSINEVRRLSRALVTPTIRDVGFQETLVELVTSYEELNLFDVRYSFDIDEGLIGKGEKLTIYRILQEAFNNTVKYAAASRVQIRLCSTVNSLLLKYNDNGVGFDVVTVKKGLGLNNIKNRAEAYKGKVQITASKGKGCRISVLFPLCKSINKYIQPKNPVLHE